MMDRTTARLLVLVCSLVMLGPSGARADGYRDIGSVSLENFFDGTWHLEVTDVFLARIIPALTVQARLTRDDTNGGWFQHQAFLGPVVSFTPTLYLDAGYGLALDSAGQFTHVAEANFNYETKATSAGLGLRGDWFPGTGYWYILPTVSGRFHLIPPLALFGKFFISIDSVSMVTESFWGEAEYAISSLLAAKVGVTASHASDFGWSAIAGVNFTFSPAVTLKYSFQYLAATVEYLDTPQQRDGVSNTFIVDVNF
jgi:hypothetical protein